MDANSLPESRSWRRGVDGPTEPALRLLCFAHAGAGSSSFNGWQRLLPPAVQVVRAQLPGREDVAATPAFDRIEPLIAHLFADLGPLFDRPLAIYGHSMGALVAFEFVRRMRASSGRLPLVLFVSGRRAPHKPMRHPHLHSMPEDDFVAHLRGMGGTPDSLLDRQLWRQRYLPTMRADLKLSDVYLYRDEPPLDCPLHAFLGEDDHEMYREDWVAWDEQSGAAFSRTLLPGGHIFTPPVQSRLIGHIGRHLSALCPALDARAMAPPALQELPC